MPLLSSNKTKELDKIGKSVSLVVQATLLVLLSPLSTELPLLVRALSLGGFKDSNRHSHLSVIKEIKERSPQDKASLVHMHIVGSQAGSIQFINVNSNPFDFDIYKLVKMASKITCRVSRSIQSSLSFLRTCEWDLFLASGLSIIAATLLLFSGCLEGTAGVLGAGGGIRADRAVIADVLLWASVALTTCNWATARTKKWVSFWRTTFLSNSCLLSAIALPLLGVGGCGWGGVNNLVSTGCGVLLMASSAISALLLILFPLPFAAKLTGKYRSLETSSFNINMVDKDGASYPLPVQVWYPTECLASQDAKKREREPDQILNGTPQHKAMLWTSGNPEFESLEIEPLLDLIADDLEKPRFLFKHIMQATTNFLWRDLQLLLASSSSSSSSSSSATPSTRQSNCNSIATPPPSIRRLSMRRREGEWFSNNTQQPEEEAQMPSTNPRPSFPVVIVSHGCYSWRQMNSRTIESLVESGCVVFSVDHRSTAMIAPPHAAPPTTFVPFDFPLPKIMKMTSKAEQRNFFISENEKRVAEVQCLMNFLDGSAGHVAAHPAPATTVPLTLSPSIGPKLAETLSLDLSKLSVLGHSFGGGTALATASRDARIKSLVLLDALMWPVADADMVRGTEAKVLALSSELWEWASYQAAMRHKFNLHSLSLSPLNQSQTQHSAGRQPQPLMASNPLSHPMLPLLVKGTNHQNFCDASMLVHWLLLQGPTCKCTTNPTEAIQVINSLTTNFIHTTFKQADESTSLPTNKVLSPARPHSPSPLPLPSPPPRHSRKLTDSPASIMSMGKSISSPVGSLLSHGQIRSPMFDKKQTEKSISSGSGYTRKDFRLYGSDRDEGSGTRITSFDSNVEEEKMGQQLVKSLLEMLYRSDISPIAHAREMTSFPHAAIFSLVQYEGPSKRKEMEMDA